MALSLLGCASPADLDGGARDGPDAYRLPDGEVADGSTTCRSVGAHRACGELCEESCPRSEGFGCRVELAVCLSWNLGAGCDLDRVVGSPGESASAVFCPDDRVSAVPPGSTVDEDHIVGRCVEPSYCAEAPAAGLDVTCFYSDGSRYERGPATSETCPFASLPSLPDFCGGPCDETCRTLLRPREVACAGVSETRGFGVCSTGPDGACHRGDPDPFECEFFRCACLLLRGADGELPDVGFVTKAMSCAAYRAEFPAEVECFDVGTWTALP